MDTKNIDERIDTLGESDPEKKLTRSIDLLYAQNEFNYYEEERAETFEEFCTERGITREEFEQLSLKSSMLVTTKRYHDDLSGYSTTVFQFTEEDLADLSASPLGSQVKRTIQHRFEEGFGRVPNLVDAYLAAVPLVTQAGGEKVADILEMIDRKPEARQVFLQRLHYGNERTTSPGRIEDVVKYLMPLTNKQLKILDVGCSSGVTTAMLASQLPQVTVIGVDLNITDAKQREQSNLTFVEGNAFALRDTFDSSQFDIVVSLNTFRHFNPIGKKRAVSSFVDVVQDGGLIMIAPLQDTHDYRNWNSKSSNHMPIPGYGVDVDESRIREGMKIFRKSNDMLSVVEFIPTLNTK